MACCGDKRNKIYGDPYSHTRSNGGSLEGSTVHRPAGAEFEFKYIGNTAMTVIGVITGNVYRFEHGGATLEVDRRDASFMTGIPRLIRTR